MSYLGGRRTLTSNCLYGSCWFMHRPLKAMKLKDAPLTEAPSYAMLA